MKIVQIVPYAMDRHGGVQRHVRDLSIWLDAQGHQTRIIAPPAVGRRPRNEGSVVELGKAWKFGAHGTGFEVGLANPVAVRRVARELKNWGADLVHLHTPWTPALAWQAWRALGLPTVTTIHATLPDAKGAGLVDRYIRRAARYFIKHSDAIVVPSPTPLGMLQTLVPDLKAYVLPPTVDLSEWRTAAQVRRQPHSVVFLGRLEPRKGVDVLLNAWPKVVEAVPKAQLTIAGAGSMQPDVEAAKSDNLGYVGRINDSEARHLLGSSQIFAAPAPYGESYGLVLAEAMSAGAIPLAAANPGYAHLLGSQRPELLCEPGDVEGLANGIIDLMRQPDRAVQLQDWVQQRALTTDVSIQGPKYLEVFKSIET